MLGEVGGLSEVQAREEERIEGVGGAVQGIMRYGSGNG